MVHLLGLSLMIAALAGGYRWLAPDPPASADIEVAVTERARQAECRNTHTMVRLADEFTNITPRLSSIGGAAPRAGLEETDPWRLLQRNLTRRPKPTAA
jgi:hypothetical protein